MAGPPSAVATPALAIYYPDLSDQPQNVQNAVKRAYDAIYQLRSQLATVVQAHNQLVQTVKNASTQATATQTQIILTENL